MILGSWPKVLGFLTSFTLIAVFWHGNHRRLHYLRRFDGPLDWLTLLQLLCIAFIPFPTAIVGEHVSDPVAQEFYFGTVLVTGLVTMALWWYASSGHRLIDPGLPSSVIRRFHLTLLAGPVVGSIALMVLIGVGIGRLVTPCCWGTSYWWATSCSGCSRAGSRVWSGGEEECPRMARPRSSAERPPTPLAWTAERGAPGNPIPRLGELRRTPSPRSSQKS